MERHMKASGKGDYKMERENIEIKKEIGEKVIGKMAKEYNECL